MSAEELVRAYSDFCSNHHHILALTAPKVSNGCDSVLAMVTVVFSPPPRSSTPSGHACPLLRLHAPFCKDFIRGHCSAQQGPCSGAASQAWPLSVFTS